MRKLLTNTISATVGMPLKSGSLDHMQAAYTEIGAALGKSLAGVGYSASTVYILEGLVNTGTGLNYNISKGTVFYAGEVYQVPAASFTITSQQKAVGQITLSYYTDGTKADPVVFTDGTPRNVHPVISIVMQPGLSNAGVGNFENFINLDKRLKGGLGQICIFDYRKYGPYSLFFDDSGAGIHPYTFGWQVCNGNQDTVNMSGLMAVGTNKNDADFNNPYLDTGGTKTTVLTPGQLPKITLTLTVKDGADTAGGGGFLMSSGNASNIGYYNPDAIISPFGNNEAHSNMPPYMTVLYVQRVA